MNLTLRPYKASDATTIVSWIKKHYNGSQQIGACSSTGENG